MSLSKPVQPSSKFSKIEDSEVLLQFSRLAVLNADVLGPFLKEEIRLVVEENQKLKWTIFYDQYSITRLHFCLNRMNTYSETSDKRYCYCKHCQKLHDQETGHAPTPTCRLLAQFKKVCDKNEIVLLITDQYSAEKKFERQHRSMYRSLTYDADAHLVLPSSGDWKLLGYGTRLTSTKNPDVLEVKKVMRLFAKVQTAWIFRGGLHFAGPNADEEYYLTESLDEEEDDQHEEEESESEDTEPLEQDQPDEAKSDDEDDKSEDTEPFDED